MQCRPTFPLSLSSFPFFLMDSLPHLTEHGDENGLADTAASMTYSSPPGDTVIASAPGAFSDSREHLSTRRHWAQMASFARQHGKEFIPSFGPGDIDTAIRPWNSANRRRRQGERYFETAWDSAEALHTGMVSLTSFNEWHRGRRSSPPRQRRGCWLGGGAKFRGGGAVGAGAGRSSAGVGLLARGRGEEPRYLDYGARGEGGYLELVRGRVDECLARAGQSIPRPPGQSPSQRSPSKR